jgi:hypothetical protein
MKKPRSLITWLIVAASAVFVFVPLVRYETESAFDLRDFGRLPVLLNGRIKPLDTIARNSLLIIHGRQTLRGEYGKTLSAIAWLAELTMKPEQADQEKIFVIRNPGTLAVLGWNSDAGKYFSFRQLFLHLEDIERQAGLAQKVDAQLRSPFQRDIIKLYERVTLLSPAEE